MCVCGGHRQVLKEIYTIGMWDLEQDIKIDIHVI